MSEEDEIFKNYKEQLQLEKEAELDEHSDTIKQFIEFCKGKDIRLNIDNFDFVPTIGVTCTHSNILLLLNPNLHLDKEELFDFNELDQKFIRKPFASGYLYSEKYMAMANSYFRRSYFYANSFSPRFVEIFWKEQYSNNDRYISLDLDRVRINVDNSMYRELDTWYGAKFNHQIENIEDGIIKLRPPLDLLERHIRSLFGDIYSLDIKWYTKGEIKVFQCEEFKADSVKIKKNGLEYYPVRYIHAEFNQATKVFRHFDGAIHFYTEEEYLNRRDSDFNHNDKSKLQIKTLSQKLFKINGSISIDQWIELTSHYLSGSYLIFEYFEGKLPDRVTEYIEVLRNST